MMTIPIILGAPLHLWLGILLFILIIFQVLVGKRILSVPFVWHRVTAIIIILLALIHGFIAIGLFKGFLSY